MRLLLIALLCVAPVAHGQTIVASSLGTFGGTGSDGTNTIVSSFGNSTVGSGSDGTNSTFSGFLFQSNVGGTGPLPVELLRFTALADGPRVQLAWTTASETNNAGFAVEARLPAGRQDPAGLAMWREIAFIPGHGTTAEAHAYAYTHTPATAAPAVRYRLRQVDLDGTATYSPETEVTLGAPQVFALGVPMPNPVRTSAMLRFDVPRAAPVRVTLFDGLGREVAVVFAGEAGPGRHAAAFDVAGFAAGVYVVRLVAAGVVVTQRLVVAR